MCEHPPTEERARWLANGLLPRGCYVEFDAIPSANETRKTLSFGARLFAHCGLRACNRKMWRRLDTHARHNCDYCKEVRYRCPPKEAPLGSHADPSR